jgi:hypothetical protein
MLDRCCNALNILRSKATFLADGAFRDVGPVFLNARAEPASPRGQRAARDVKRRPMLQTRRKAIARATDLGRVLIAPPSFPLCTIHSPFDACPVIMPT